jgi:Homeodomain-like domain
MQQSEPCRAARVTDWLQRMDKIRARRTAAGLPIGRVTISVLVREALLDLSTPEGTGEQYEPNRVFDYAEDVERYPFSWWPTEPIRISMSVPGICQCGAPVRQLKPKVLARPRLCASCLVPDEIPASVFRREGDPVRVAALYLPGLGDALDAPPKAPKKKRGAYTIDQKREAVRLYSDTNMTMPEVAEKLGVPLASVKNWVRRYQDDPYFAS